MRLGGWMVMLTGLVLFLTLVGLPTGLTSILNSLGITINPVTAEITAIDIESSSFWSEIFGTTGILVAVIGTGVGSVLVGLFGKGYDPSLVYAPFIVAVAAIFISTFWGIISYVMSFGQLWMTSIVGLMFGVLGVGFVMSCVDYFGGR